MGKRRETSTEDDLSLELSDLSPSPKKHKKHKHKKHKKSKSHDNDLLADLCSEAEVLNKTPASTEKVKQFSTKNNQDQNAAIPSTSRSTTPPKVKKKKRKDSGTSSEEERWLDAIESGKLEEVDDELKKIKPKDPKLMTARQRAMYDRGGEMAIAVEEQLMSLPSGYKEKVMTAEAIQKAALKSQKRKQLADEKREKDKKKTMERLLKKQESKTGKATKCKVSRSQEPYISYKQNNNFTTLSFPNGIVYPLVKQERTSPPKIIVCHVDGCNNPKKYNCNKTNVPLCSLLCYKKHFENLRKIIF